MKYTCKDGGGHCAMGHLGAGGIFNDKHNIEIIDGLLNVFGAGLQLINTNDGDDRLFQQSTPKKRVLAALQHYGNVKITWRDRLRWLWEMGYE